jgi:hypothetical protein
LAARLVSKYFRLVMLMSAAIFVALPALARQVVASNVGTDPAHQVGSQVDRLIALIKDEYATEAPNGRRVQFIDVPRYGTIAIATFVVQGFGDGNNVHQYLAIFGPPNDPATVPTRRYYALSALTEIGDGCAVDVRGVRFSGLRGDGSLTLTLPTFTSSTTGSCEGRTRRSYVLRTSHARLGRLELRESIKPRAAKARAFPSFGRRSECGHTAGR